MDIKAFVTAQDGLEQWNPLMKGEFPLPIDVLRNDVFGAFKVDVPELPADACDLDRFLAIVAAHDDLQAVRVHKQRFGYMVNGTICEVANVLINGAGIDDIKKTIEDLGLTGVENINYLQAIKRVIGWIDAPLAN